MFSVDEMFGLYGKGMTWEAGFIIVMRRQLTYIYFRPDYCSLLPR